LRIGPVLLAARWIVGHRNGRYCLGPGFVDLDALSDLDTTVLGYDNQPAWKKGRVWSESYMLAGPSRRIARTNWRCVGPLAALSCGGGERGRSPAHFAAFLRQSEP
jgi:hypothetical protein